MTSVKKAFLRLFPERVRPVVETALAGDLYLGCVLGAGAGYWASAVRAVENTESTDLLALAGAGVGLLAATLAAIALLLGFMTGRTLDLISISGGFPNFVRPFRLIAVVGAIAVLASVAGAIDTSSMTRKGTVSPGPPDLAAVLFGLAIWFFVWAVVGVAQLVRIFIGYGDVHLRANSPAHRVASEAAAEDEDARLLKAASKQLGDEKPSVRLAGVYAMARLADDSPKMRQNCIKALCGYLSAPYDPEHESATITDQQMFRTLREVRHTIIRTITAHLQPDDRRPATAQDWRGLDLDFTGAVFDGGDFADAEFTGRVSFNRTRFASGTVSFNRTRFAGGEVSFDYAEFSGGTVAFDDARFTGGLVHFGNAVFSDGTVDFDHAEFSQGRVDFRGAVFSGGEVSFTSAVFAGGEVSFEKIASWRVPPQFPSWTSPPSGVTMPSGPAGY